MEDLAAWLPNIDQTETSFYINGFTTSQPDSERTSFFGAARPTDGHCGLSHALFSQTLVRNFVTYDSKVCNTFLGT